MFRASRITRALPELFAFERSLTLPPSHSAFRSFWKASQILAGSQCPLAAADSSCRHHCSLRDGQSGAQISGQGRLLWSVQACYSSFTSQSVQYKAPGSLALVQPAHDRMLVRDLPPKARVTDDEHPCGEGKVEWPFNAKAFYVGELSGLCESKKRVAASLLLFKWLLNLA